MLAYACYLGSCHLHGDLKAELPSHPASPTQPCGDCPNIRVRPECSDILRVFPRKAAGPRLGKLQSRLWAALTSDSFAFSAPDCSPHTSHHFLLSLAAQKMFLLFQLWLQ